MNKSTLIRVLHDSYIHSTLAREGSSALLDEYFVQTHLPLRVTQGAVDVASVLQLWAKHLGLSEGLAQRWSGQLSPAVADFLVRLETNLKAHQVSSPRMDGPLTSGR
ncbi:MAG: hypothetical protein IVW51_02655 [Thermaceae bacterium]|nr:hypothetical protein [Thermaceae bacterium]